MIRDRSENVEAGHGLGGFLRKLLEGIPWSERAEGTLSMRVDMPAEGKLRIDNPNGRTEVIGEDRDDIDIQGTTYARAESSEAAERLLQDIRLTPNRVEDALVLEVDVPRRWNRRGNANLEIRVPRGCDVEVLASNGRVCLRGLEGHLKARSSNGAVRVSEVSGDIEVATSNATVKCTCTCGRLVARSSNGKIDLRGHTGSVDATTSNGVIHAELDQLGRDGVQLATSNGRIVLELPEDVDADVDMRVDNGVIRNDLELLGATQTAAGRLRGTLGRGGISIRLRTSNGSICLR